MLLGLGVRPELFLQLPSDPLPFGPGTWSWKQWLGLGVYALLFLVFLVLVARLARPERGSEGPPHDAES